MPIYEYQCDQCGHRLESFEKITDSPLTECPVCGRSTLQKLISAAGFQLKGTGWYATDFRDKGKPSAATPKEENVTPPANAKEATPNVKDSKPATDSKTKDTAVT
ncbi:MAG: FmdB family transcriptional regulator [Gammaproteobacteria bacterium]|jgi:putative FmdB family regulatory protein|nr:FmdB family transcriptional regulator [Gammaproteobacteria bacterium]